MISSNIFDSQQLENMQNTHAEEKLDKNGMWCATDAKGLLDPYITETMNSQYVTHILTPLLNT
jgi:hypothetical protein